MRNEKRSWNDEAARKSRVVKRKKIERMQEMDDEILIKNALAMFNGYNGGYDYTEANAGWEYTGGPDKNAA